MDNMTPGMISLIKEETNHKDRKQLYPRFARSYIVLYSSYIRQSKNHCSNPILCSITFYNFLYQYVKSIINRLPFRRQSIHNAKYYLDFFFIYFET